MKKDKKLKFDAQHAELIGQSFNDFKNDAVKAAVVNNVAGIKKGKPICIYHKTAQPFL